MPILTLNLKRNFFISVFSNIYAAVTLCKKFKKFHALIFIKPLVCFSPFWAENPKIKTFLNKMVKVNFKTLCQ